MKTCSVCDREITPQMIRHGRALSRGGHVVHRECHGVSERSPGAARPRTSARPALEAVPGMAPLLTVEYASFWRRLGANLIDGLILNLILLVIVIPFGVGSALKGGSPGTGQLLGTVLGLFIPIAYSVSYWCRRGATPGKTALGIRVVNADDGDPTTVQSLVRYLGYFLSSLPFCLGYAWMLWDREKRCWHDILSGTRVIRA